MLRRSYRQVCPKEDNTPEKTLATADFALEIARALRSCNVQRHFARTALGYNRAACPINFYPGDSHER
jgi:hypothetical protein